MAKHIVRFRANKPVQVPVVVKFHTKDGKAVTFKATETINRPAIVKFRAKEK